jgi:Fibronectin type III domain
VTIRVGRGGGERRGYRAALLVLLPVLLSGCSVLGSLTGGSGNGSSSAATPSPSGSAWIVVARGSATPSPVPRYPAAAPSTGVPAGFLLLPSSGSTPAVPPGPSCSAGTDQFAEINALAVTPGPTSARVSWYDTGGYNLVQFRVTAISQRLMPGKQHAVGWVTVTPKAPCGPMSATITGLSRKTGYVFSVDAVVTQRSGNGTHAATVLRSHVVSTT